MLTDEEDRLIDYLEAHYGCHSFILYGSRAMGRATPTSDWDVLAINDGKRNDWCHRTVEGVGEVNCYIYPASQVPYDPAKPSPLYQQPEYFVRLRHGRVLIEEAGFATSIIQRAQQIFDAGPGKKPPHFDEHLRHQCYNYFLRKIGNPDIDDMERQYQRSWMLYTCLHHYFRHREMWWGMAPRDGFAWLKEHDPASHAAFETALKPGATLAQLETLLDHVLDPKFNREG